MEHEEFVNYLKSLKEKIFIEAEARPDKMKKFITDYNSKYSQSIDLETPGICTLGEDVDKWGVELRVYLNNISNMPEYWLKRKYNNRKYRADEFSYRIDDNSLVWELFRNGYRIGNNN